MGMWEAGVGLGDRSVTVGHRDATMGTEMWPWGQKWDPGDSAMRVERPTVAKGS